MNYVFSPFPVLKEEQKEFQNTRCLIVDLSFGNNHKGHIITDLYQFASMNYVKKTRRSSVK